MRRQADTVIDHYGLVLWKAADVASPFNAIKKRNVAAKEQNTPAAYVNPNRAAREISLRGLSQNKSARHSRELKNKFMLWVSLLIFFGHLRSVEQDKYYDDIYCIMM